MRSGILFPLRKRRAEARRQSEKAAPQLGVMATLEVYLISRKTHAGKGALDFGANLPAAVLWAIFDGRLSEPPYSEAPVYDFDFGFSTRR